MLALSQSLSLYLYGTVSTKPRKFEVGFGTGAIGLSFRSIGGKFIVREARAQAAAALVVSGDCIVGVNGTLLTDMRQALPLGARSQVSCAWV